MPGPLKIKQVWFRCNGCKIEWSAFPAQMLTSAVEIEKYLATEVQPCPTSCGATHCDVAVAIDGAPSTESPFKHFDKKS